MFVYTRNIILLIHFFIWKINKVFVRNIISPKISIKIEVIHQQRIAFCD